MSILTVFSSLLGFAQNLNVTDGKVTTKHGVMEVASKEMRAVQRQNMPTDAKVELSFTYIGPSKEVSRLGNGEVRHQIGLKLFAQDPCNLLYVMWDFGYPSNLRVSVKLNPSSDWRVCRDGGYNVLKPTLVKALPAIEIGSSHVLTVETKGVEFTAYVDGNPVWSGVNNVNPALCGPAGIRSDNVHAAFNLAVTEVK